MRSLPPALVLLTALASAAIAAPPPGLDTKQIESATGATGAFDYKEGAFKVSLPRPDLGVTVAGVRLPPSMGAASWASFKRIGPNTVVMGDVIVGEDQVDHVMDAALNHGLNVTALHTHFLWASPQVLYMHVDGMGPEARIVQAMGAVFQASRAAGDPAPEVKLDLSHSMLDPARIDAVLRKKGDLQDGVYKIVWGRSTRMHGDAMGQTMGVNTWAAFAGSDDQAVVDGDFAMYEQELQSVLRALRGSRIHVTAIHQHMVSETPRVMFLHYWGVGPTQALAEGLRAALEQTTTVRGRDNVVPVSRSR